MCIAKARNVVSTPSIHQATIMHIKIQSFYYPPSNFISPYCQRSVAWTVHIYSSYFFVKLLIGWAIIKADWRDTLGSCPFIADLTGGKNDRGQETNIYFENMNECENSFFVCLNISWTQLYKWMQCVHSIVSRVESFRSFSKRRHRGCWCFFIFTFLLVVDFRFSLWY